jgi:hypothetical protein
MELKQKFNQTDGFHRKCTDNKTFLKEELWCDGYTQCLDGSDEDPSDCGN